MRNSSVPIGVALVFCIGAAVCICAFGEQPFPVLDSNYFSYGDSSTPMAPKPLTPLDQDYFQSKRGDLRASNQSEPGRLRRRREASRSTKCTTVYGPTPSAAANFLATTIKDLCAGPPSVHFRNSQMRTYPTNLNPYNPSYGQQAPLQEAQFDGSYVVCCLPKYTGPRHPVVE